MYVCVDLNFLKRKRHCKLDQLVGRQLSGNKEEKQEEDTAEL